MLTTPPKCGPNDKILSLFNHVSYNTPAFQNKKKTQTKKKNIPQILPRMWHSFENITITCGFYSTMQPVQLGFLSVSVSASLCLAIKSSRFAETWLVCFGKWKTETVVQFFSANQCPGLKSWSVWERGLRECQKEFKRVQTTKHDRREKPTPCVSDTWNVQ